MTKTVIYYTLLYLVCLKFYNAPYKIQLEPETIKGFGCRMKPEIGKEAALESTDEIIKVLIDC